MESGWYADPIRANSQRFWDGLEWTNHVSGAGGQTVDGGVPPQTPGPILVHPPAPPPPAYATNTIHGQPGQLVVAPKNPAVSLLISFFIPGLGSIINGNTTTGVVILICWIVSWVLTVVIIGFIGLTAFWIWGMVDAYQSAQRWNLSHGIVS